MAISCETNDLASAGKCFCYADQRQVDSVIIYLLTQIAGNTSTPAQLARDAAGYSYPDTRSRDAVMLYLLCAIASAAGA